jgi:hypothetical protein
MAQLNDIDNNTEILQTEDMEIESKLFLRISNLNSKHKDMIIVSLLNKIKRWMGAQAFNNMVEELLRETNVK